VEVDVIRQRVDGLSFGSEVDAGAEPNDDLNERSAAFECLGQTSGTHQSVGVVERMVV